MNEIEYKKENSGGKIIAGIILVAVGVILLMRKMGYYIPSWLLSWPMLVVTIGLYGSLKHRFKNAGWVIVLLIGLVFLADNFVAGFEISRYIWPVVIIIAGLFMVFGKRNKQCGKNAWQGNIMVDSGPGNPGDSVDRVESVTIFGGISKRITSKEFKGGEVTCIFSGAELDLSQADFNGKITLELTNILGGTKLIVPANWEIQSDIVAIFGGIEDKRPQSSAESDNKKVLHLQGTSVFGGIEIKNY